MLRDPGKQFLNIRMGKVHHESFKEKKGLLCRGETGSLQRRPQRPLSDIVGDERDIVRNLPEDLFYDPGLSIQNYELEGRDRVTYGDRLFSKLAGDLTSRGVSNCSRHQLYHYRDFYLAYPHIVGSLHPQSGECTRIFFTVCLTRISRNSWQSKIPGNDRSTKRNACGGTCPSGNCSVSSFGLYYERTAMSQN